MYNELSQITPMPEAWDRTASGPSHCSTTISDCSAVYSYLDGQSKDLSTYATSPLWGIVDGPWKLSAFNADGHLRLCRTSLLRPGQAEAVGVQGGAVHHRRGRVRRATGAEQQQQHHLGYIPTEDLPSKPLSAAVGSNPLPGYYLAPQVIWGVNYYTLN